MFVLVHRPSLSFPVRTTEEDSEQLAGLSKHYIVYEGPHACVNELNY